MITDGDVFIVRQQGVIRPKQLADVGRVMDADVEIGVVANGKWQVHRAVRGGVQAGRHDLLLCWIGQQGEQCVAQKHSRTGRQGKQRVQVRLRQRGMNRGGQDVCQLTEVHNIIANGAADAWSSAI